MTPGAERPRFSIIMPTFRREHVVGRAIDSIQRQTFPDWELVVVDNAGSRGRFDDPRIRWFVYTERRGASHARNFGIGLIRGELASFFDDDDVMHPQYLETFDRVFRDPGVMMARCGMLTGPDRTRLDFSFATPEVVVRSEHVTPNWESCDCHDQRYFLRLAADNGWTGGQIVRIEEPLVTAMTEIRGGRRDPEGSL